MGACKGGPAGAILLGSGSAEVALRLRPCGGDFVVAALRWQPWCGGPGFGGLAILQSAISKELCKFGAWRRKSTELIY